MNDNADERDYLIHMTVYQKAKDTFSDVDMMKIRRLAMKDDLFEIIREHHLMISHAVR
jgi:uncharacterized protein YdcH (DUF465 family)